MQKILLLLALLFIPLYFCFSQSDTTMLSRMGEVAVASCIFAAYDYIGYNVCKKSPSLLVIYRISQFILQGILTWQLWEHGGFRCALSFNLLWWTFVDDLIYYGYASIANPSGSWENKNSTKEALSNVTWAYWTPIGIVKGMKRNVVIEKPLLYWQASIGVCVSFTILF